MKKFKSFEEWAKNGMPSWYWILIDNISTIISSIIIGFILSLLILMLIPTIGQFWAKNEIVMKAMCIEILKE